MPRIVTLPSPPARRIAVRYVAERIVVIRGQRVMLDRDLATLYGVTTAAVNQAVSRNPNRFPADFAFMLTGREVTNLISQSVISSGHGGHRKPLRVFTEHGVAMLSSVLKSSRAVAVNVAIMRAFVRLRELASSHADLTRQIAELERKYDGKFTQVFGAIRRLMSPPVEIDEPRRRIGFVVDRLPRARRV